MKREDIKTMHGKRVRRIKVHHYDSHDQLVFNGNVVAELNKSTGIITFDSRLQYKRKSARLGFKIFLGVKTLGDIEDMIYNGDILINNLQTYE